MPCTCCRQLSLHLCNRAFAADNLQELLPASQTKQRLWCPCLQEWGLGGGAYASPFGAASYGPPPEAFAAGTHRPSSGSASHNSAKLQKQGSDNSCLPCMRSTQSVQTVRVAVFRAACFAWPVPVFAQHIQVFEVWGWPGDCRRSCLVACLLACMHAAVAACSAAEHACSSATQHVD